MVVERFVHGPRPVYERAEREGRMLPEGCACRPVPFRAVRETAPKGAAH